MTRERDERPDEVRAPGGLDGRAVVALFLVGWALVFAVLAVVAVVAVRALRS